MKYKNITIYDLQVIGIGEFKAGETIETSEEIINSNLQLIIEKPIKAEEETDGN